MTDTPTPEAVAAILKDVTWVRNNIEALAADLAAQKARADAAERRFANAERMLTQAETTLASERDKVAKLVEALRTISGECGCSTARAAIAEVQG